MKFKILLIWALCTLTVLFLICGCNPGNHTTDTTLGEVTEEAAPSDEPISTKGDEPVISEPGTEPVTTEPETEPVTTEPETEPVTTEPETEPVTTEPETEPVTTEPETEPVTTAPETEPVTTEPETEPEPEPCIHKDTEWHTVIAPTCAESGYDQQICMLCGVILDEKTVDALGHTEVIDDAIEPTCTQAGKTIGSHCSVCLLVLKEQQQIPMLEHTTAILPGKSPSCTQEGLTEGLRCSVCQSVLTPQDVIPALGHDPVIIQPVEPTCTTPGSTEGAFCSVCQETLTECQPLPAKGHTEAILPGYPPTETTAGLTDGVICSVCYALLVPQDRLPPTGEATQPETEPITEPVTEPATEPVTEPVTEPETESETESESETEPDVPSGTAVWDGSVGTGFAGGNGSAENPYRILTASQLAYLAQIINTGRGNQYTGCYFRLDANLDLGGLEWTPIGSSLSYGGSPAAPPSFQGHFDGNGHTVSRFRLTAQNATSAYLGLFGMILNGSVQSLGVTDFEINGSASQAVYAGGVVGYAANSVIRSCYAQGAVEITVAEDDASSYVGGLAGRIDGAVGICSADVSISVISEQARTSLYAGGLIGVLTDGDLQNCYATGHLLASATGDLSVVKIGGLVGESLQNAIQNVYATGCIEAISEYEVRAGGLVGNYSNGKGLANSWASGDISVTCSTARFYVGNLLGKSKEGAENCYQADQQRVFINLIPLFLEPQGSTCTAAQLKNETFYTTELGWDTDVWVLPDSSAGGKLPSLRQTPTGSDNEDPAEKPDDGNNEPGLPPEVSPTLDYTDASLYANDYYYQYLGTLTKGGALQAFYKALDTAALAFHTDSPDAQSVQVSGGQIFRYFSVQNYAVLGLTLEEAGSVISLYLYDHPLYYWLSSGYVYSTSDIYLCVYPEYADGDIRAAYNSMIYESVRHIMEQVGQDTSAYALTLAFHDIICEETDYAYEADGTTPQDDVWAHNIIGWFDGMGAVCEGYSETFSLLLNFCDVENLVVCGQSAGQGHQWNLVQMDDGEWYWYDVTWNDRPDSELGVKHLYFCVTDEQNVYRYLQDGGYIITETMRFIDDHTVSWGAHIVLDMSHVLPTRGADAYDSPTLTLREAFTVNGITYALMGHQEVQVVNIQRTGQVTVPETVSYGGETYTVIAIGAMDQEGVIIMESALNEGITALNLPKSLRHVWSCALSCRRLQSVQIDAQNPGVAIDFYAFYDCALLSEVTLPKGLTSIGKQAFLGCFSLRTLNYHGSASDWKAIPKDSEWAYTLTFCIVNCSDQNLTV